MRPVLLFWIIFILFIVLCYMHSYHLYFYTFVIYLYMSAVLNSLYSNINVSIYLVFTQFISSSL